MVKGIDSSTTPSGFTLEAEPADLHPAMEVPNALVAPEWNCDSVGVVGAKLDVQQSDARKVVCPYYCDSIAPKAMALPLGPKVDTLAQAPKSDELMKWVSASIQSTTAEAEKKQEVEQSMDLTFGVGEKASSVFNWLWSLFTGTENTKAKAHAVTELSETQRKQMQETMLRMKAILRHLDELQMNEEEMMTFETFMRQYMVNKEEESEIVRQGALQNFRTKKNLTSEIYKIRAEGIDLQRQKTWWAKLEELSTGLQLFSTGMSLRDLGVAAGAARNMAMPGHYGIALMLFAVGNAVDGLLDNPVKKALLKALGYDSNEKQKDALFYMRFGIGALALAGSLYYGKMSSLLAAASIVQGVSGALEGVTGYRDTLYQAKILDKEFKKTNATLKFKENMGALDKTIKSQQQLYLMMRKKKQYEGEATVSMLRDIKPR